MAREIRADRVGSPFGRINPFGNGSPFGGLNPFGNTDPNGNADPNGNTDPRQDLQDILNDPLFQWFLQQVLPELNQNGQSGATQ